MSRTAAIEAIEAYFDEGRFQQDLAELVAIRSESQNPDAAPELRRYLVEAMVPRLERLGFVCEVFDNPVEGGGPLLIGERHEGDALPTVLTYGHGDVIRGQKGMWRKGLEPFRLIEEGEPAECVFTVLEGILKLYKLMPDGRRQVTGFLIPGDFVGLAFGESYIYTAEAVVEGAACRFTRNQFHRMMEEFPALEGRLLSKVSTELAAAQEQMLLLGRKTARERLATFLLGLARRMNRSAGEQVRLPMGRADIADFLGLTVETVSRTFTAMRKAGYLSTVDKHGVVITDLDRLREAAGD